MPAPTIQAIQVFRYEIFDSTETRHWWARVANALHFMTREGVVRRELLFKVGEPYDSAKVAETARNLRQLYIFRQVRVDSVTVAGVFTIEVITKDGWTTKSDFRFRSTGGQTEWGVTYSENNLLGTASLFTIRYKKNPDRSSVLFQFQQPRFLSRTIGLGMVYDHRSDGERAAMSVGHPFYTLETRNSFNVGGAVERGNVLHFVGGERVASDTLWRQYALGSAEVAKALHASSAGYLRVGAVAQVRRDDYVPLVDQANTPRTVTAAAGGYLEWRRAKFLVTRGFATIGRDEDVDVSRTFRVGMLLAPKAFGYERNGIGGLASLRFGSTFPGGFAFIDARANALLTAAGVDSGWVQLGGLLALHPAKGQLALLHADYGWLKRPLPGSEFDLGFSVGPRAFPIHAFTGDREYFLTGEYRVTLFPDLFRFVGVGVAGFGDNGGAWYNGSARRTGSAVGLGLRLGPTRSAGLDPVRVDLAYRFKNDVSKSGWVLVIAKGFPFSPTMRP